MPASVNARTANKSGLAKATIYHHFADKQDIWLLSVLEREIAPSINERTAEAVNSPGNAIDRLRAGSCTFYDLQAERHVVFMSAIREMSLPTRRSFAIYCGAIAMIRSFHRSIAG